MMSRFVPSFLHLATTDRGGAGIAATDIHHALLGAGYASRMLIDHGAGAPGIHVLGGALPSAARAASKAWFKLTTHPQYYFRDQRYDRPGVENVSQHFSATPDAIVCHAVTNFLSFPTIARRARESGARLLWSLMDMASFTGGCHYAWDCLGYQHACGNCPALRLSSPKDWSARTLQEKRQALTGTRSTVIAASSWLADQARKSALFADTPVEIVPLSVSPDRFRPRDRSECRADLGLSQIRPVLFFGARDLGDARKGMDVMVEALSRMATRLPSERLPTLLIAGDGSPFQALAALGYPIRQLGLVGLDTIADAYAVADVFVSPSLEDSGPMMINQAVMSGAPVAAFSVGVAPDLVQHDVTGRLARHGSAEALTDDIEEILGWDVDRSESARARAREIGMALCSPVAQAGAFARLATGEG